MSEHDSERKGSRPPVSTEGLEALLDRWVSDLERGGPWSDKRPESPSAPPNRIVPEQPPLFDEPSPATEHSTPASEPRENVQERAPTTGDEVRSARARLRVQGMGVFFPDDGAHVLLAREQGHLVHRGTVAVRGPCALSREEWGRLGVSATSAQGLEFVLAWFGSPFDAAGAGPSWGVWSFSGDALVQALARWKRLEPATFEARLGTLGIRVLGESPESPTLAVVDVTKGQPVQGREALALLGDDPLLFAALVRAGREKGARLGQVACLVEQSLSLTGEDSPRVFALRWHAELRLGRRGVSRFDALLREEAGAAGGAQRAGLRFANALRSSGHHREAGEVRRIVSSPELDGVSAR
ncbi:hypothetical protein [Myxococcus landrumensis]|uniref:Uncharacterized protein n=1 Tax=Myxococcus landrumensis TaxID=2813577 RepID=A0ABX7N271_9BACT|nr:hypothetical protein [Myxococcus landrumus]QSQ12806.1 hypothetical protein JY572_31330 [Myxococcus landrumus]